jgi:anti-sigma B factor antagonist
MSAEDYELRPAGRQSVITMPAEIDLTNAGQVREALFAALRPGAAVLIIDMSRTTFCDSAGVHAIIAAYRRTATAGTQLRLVAARVRRIFTVIGIDQLIPVYPTLDAALAEAPIPPASTAEGGDEPGGYPPARPPDMRRS